ncbi:MAG: Fic family protein [Verrucomicrobia bacterium]|nr:Fic family protein [Verrucomicrobiota bacterium]
MGRLQADASYFCCDNPVCNKIVQIWSDFCAAIASCFSKIYRYCESFFVTPFPMINQNMSNDALLKLYWGLGRDEKWRECIDGRYHHLGKYVFDRGAHAGTVEPGFVGSMEGAFAFVERYLNMKIDADWYLRLHRHTCAHFNGDPSAFLMGQEKVGVFRDIDDYINCTLAGDYRVSLEAKAEFEALDQEIKREFGSSYGLGEMIYTDALQQTVRLNYKAMSRQQIRRIFDKFLNEFYREVEHASTPDAKLWAIAKLQQRLEWLHPVKDGTARTSTALMNKFLTDYGFHPAILDYPHVSSSYTLRRWKEYLQNGLVKWERERTMHNPSAGG